MIFYTSDLHLGHRNILKYENRPFKDTDEMDSAIIYNWNARVERNDEVYVLGDFTLRGATKAINYLENLNGYIHLLKGNHDHFIDQESFGEWLVSGQSNYPRVETEGHYKHLHDGKHEVVLCHYPILYWDGQDDRGSIHLYGHMHKGEQHSHPDAYNVGVDLHMFVPLTLEEIIQRGKT